MHFFKTETFRVCFLFLFLLFLLLWWVLSTFLWFYSYCWTKFQLSLFSNIIHNDRTHCTILSWFILIFIKIIYLYLFFIWFLKIIFIFWFDRLNLRIIFLWLLLLGDLCWLKLLVFRHIFRRWRYNTMLVFLKICKYSLSLLYTFIYWK